MMTFEKLITSVTVLGFACLLPLTAPAQGTAIRLQVTGSTNVLWDVTKVQELQNSQMEFEDGLRVGFANPFTQSGAGKLTGAGNTQVAVQLMSAGQPVAVPPFTAEYVTKGSISSSKGVAKVVLSSKVTGFATIEGEDRKVSASSSLIVSIDSESDQVSGRYTYKAAAAGLGSDSTKGTIDDTIPAELGDGSWTITLNFQPTTGNKLGGTGLVKLSTGQEYHFTLTGVYTPKNQQSKLTLKGTDAGLGSVLKVIMVGPQSITKISGRVSGQKVNLNR